MDKNTVMQMAAVLRTGDWVKKSELFSVPHWDEHTARQTLTILEWTGVVRTREDGCVQWIRGTP